jgi:hypothetical protein
MGTLKGFPCPPALWLQRAKPAFAYAIMGTLKGFAPPFGPRPPPPPPPPQAPPPPAFGPPPATPTPLASLGLAVPSRALAPAGKDRLRLCGPFQFGKHGPFFFGQRVAID